jgi:hypothetical protein
MLKAFPYLCKSTRAGEVVLHGQFPQLQVAVAPADAHMHLHAGALLDRVLQTVTTGKKLEFLGLGGDGRLGSNGAARCQREGGTAPGWGRRGESSGGGGGQGGGQRKESPDDRRTDSRAAEAGQGWWGGAGSTASTIAASMFHPAVMPTSGEVKLRRCK